MQPFDQHNREVQALWNSFHAGKPDRVPVTVGISSRFAVHSSELNPNRYTMKQYCTEPDVMFELQLALAEMLRFRVETDHEMGVPENGWGVAVDFQNYYEAAWFGCPIAFPDNGMPTASLLLTDDAKHLLLHKGIPDPFSDIMKTGIRFVERFRELADHCELRGAAVTSTINGAGLWMDGPFTIACELRGLTEFCMDLYEDPDYALQMLDYLTEATIHRIKSWRKYHGLPVLASEFEFADDSITMLDNDTVRKLLVPRYRRLLQELCTPDAVVGMHLCGDAGWLFPMLQQELGLKWFDTGFPLDHRQLAVDLQDQAYFMGGPHIGLLLNGTPHEIRTETNSGRSHACYKTIYPS